MKRPEVTAENHHALYEYYSQRTPNKQLAKIGHKILGSVIRPQITWDENAEEAVKDQLANNKPLLLAFKHIKSMDVVLPAVLLQREPTLHPMIGRSRILAKKSLFMNPILRRLLDGLGAIPTFRPKDRTGATVSGLTDSLLHAIVERQNWGEHIAGFPEGERRPNQPGTVQELNRGLVEVATRAQSPDDILPVAVGVAYAPGRFTGRIALHVTTCPAFTNGAADGLDALRRHLQYATTMANQNLTGID